MDDTVAAGDGTNLTQEMVWSWPRRVRTQAYVEKSHSLMDRSDEDVARWVPVGVKAALWTVLVCPLRVRT